MFLCSLKASVATQNKLYKHIIIIRANMRSFSSHDPPQDLCDSSHPEMKVIHVFCNSKGFLHPIPLETQDQKKKKNLQCSTRSLHLHPAKQWQYLKSKSSVHATYVTKVTSYCCPQTPGLQPTVTWTELAARTQQMLQCSSFLRWVESESSNAGETLVSSRGAVLMDDTSRRTALAQTLTHCVLAEGR